VVKKIVFKKDINSNQPNENKSNVELKSFKRNSDKNSDFTFNEDNITEALKNIIDPELPVSIVDLGLIYNIETVDNNINIKMTLTTPGCSMGSAISRQIENTLYALGAKNVIVEILWDPPWNPNMMSDEAKAKLGM
tara:strand:+ start:709 stop:1116 length:408 start_codon:yes stop_codon:yes gene_type:complete